MLGIFFSFLRVGVFFCTSSFIYIPCNLSIFSENILEGRFGAHLFFPLFYLNGGGGGQTGCFVLSPSVPRASNPAGWHGGGRPRGCTHSEIQILDGPLSAR